MDISTFKHCNEKLVPFKEIGKLSEKLKKQGKKVVSLNGSFDLMHSGHVYMIQESKKQGDVLIIGLNSNESYKKYKDVRGPLVDEKDRAIMIAAMEDVNYITLFDDATCVPFVEAVKPNVHCNGAEYGKDCVEAEAVKKHGGKLYLIPELKDEKEGKEKFSTTLLIQRIIERFSTPKIKAVFLDRDGIINVDTGYVYKIEDFKLVEGITELLKYLVKLGYKLFVITNQSGIARGYFKVEDMYKFNSHISEELKKKGVKFEEIYFCPHHPEAKVEQYKTKCDCRKPGFVLFQKAKKEYNIDMAKSWSIGDKLSDCIAGKKAGTKTILLNSRYISESDRKSEYVDYVVEKLKEVKNIINE